MKKMKIKNKEYIKKVIAWTLLIIWLIVIFSFSNQNGDDSGNLSQMVLDFLTKVLNINFNNDIGSFIVRKSAHFFEYFVLGSLIFNVLIKYFKVSTKLIIISLLMGAFYSLTDETHQMFVAGRAFKVLDIFIDSIGALAGSFILYLFTYKRKYKEGIKK